VTRVMIDGLRLNVEEHGAGAPLLLLHGFTGSAETWSAFARHAPFRTLAVDLPGHGRSDSPRDAAPYSIDRTVEHLLSLLALRGIERLFVLGYSMGGRIALHLALAAPERVTALCLESASPGIEDASRREARVASDAALADLIEREGVTAFVDRWEQTPLFASQKHLPSAVRAALREQRLRNSAIGLANSLRAAGAARQRPLWERLPELTMPVLLLAGALDTAYCEVMRRMAGSLPHANLVVVPEAGHAVHLEAPAAFNTAVLPFFTNLEQKERDHDRITA
jgi:2-succinyl-6-hydroxy-2,4-cyclohexadiene-1-carboxylate synthase